jgi:hypothetical protein
MIISGDCDPPAPVRTTIDRYLGTNYVWYPAIGNHELGSKTNMVWLRNFPEVLHFWRAGLGRHLPRRRQRRDL